MNLDQPIDMSTLTLMARILNVLDTHRRIFSQMRMNDNQALLRREIYFLGFDPVSQATFRHRVSRLFSLESCPETSTLKIHYYEPRLEQIIQMPVENIHIVSVGGGPGTQLYAVSLTDMEVTTHQPIFFLRDSFHEDHRRYWSSVRDYELTYQPFPPETF